MDETEQPRSWETAFEQRNPHLKDFVAFLPEMEKESDRGMALIATSFINELIRRTLLAFMLEGKVSVSLVEGFNAPLGAFATRCAAAFALGLVTEREKLEADQLRRVRNRFAHHVHVSFDDEEVQKLCESLTMAAQDYGKSVVSARGRFSTAAVALILNLTNRPHYVAQARRMPATWRI